MADTFFYEPLLLQNEKTFTLSENTAKHCIQVLRMKAGDIMELTNGKGLLCKASIENIDRKNCLVKIIEEQIHPPSSHKISIAISILKNADRFEWFAEKATEMGVNEIIPLICNRTIRHNFRKERMQNIIISAMLQSQQLWLPQLHDAVSFEKYISSSPNKTKLIAHCGQAEKKRPDEIIFSSSAEIIIGPEGDFTSNEIIFATENNYIPVSLGHTRLRTETAGVVAAALLTNKIRG